MSKYQSVWDAISDTPEEAANMKMRSALMAGIVRRVEEMEGTQAEKAERFGLTQPRLNDLLKGRIGKFSLDALVNLAVRVGMKVELEIKAA